MGDVFNLYIEGIGIGQHYGFIAWGPNWPFHEDWYAGSIHGFLADVDADGHRFNPNKLLLDPWARAIHRDHDWSKGSLATGPARTESTFAAASKAVVTESKYEWSENEASWRENRQNADFVNHKWNDVIVYEVHLKGMTKNTASGVEHAGTYRGLGEKADYLADLGITAVELLPVQEKPADGGYWGYQTLGFFAPEGSYAADPRPGFIVDEFKWMVDELHKRDIEVFMDVVYNHTGEGGLWREKIQYDDVSLWSHDDLVNFDPKEVVGLYSFRGFDNKAWYALSEDNQTYWNNTGVGNETRPNHTPMRRLTMDSLRYWVEELHIDGYRFDLAPVLGEVDLNYNSWDDPMNTVLGDIIKDETLNKYNTRVIAEPWSLAHFKLGAFPASPTDPALGWYEWNANFRDFWRSFLNVDEHKLNSAEGPIDAGGALTGSHALFNWNSRHPYHSVNFLTAHDGFTLYDLFSYNEKHNACGPLNPVCCDAPNSPFCDLDSGDDHNRSRDWGDEATKRQMIRNAFVALMLSHGTPMMLGGDEWLRSQLGNNNAYSTGADNEWNWFRWGEWQAKNENLRMHDFVRDLIAFRKSHKYAFAPDAYDNTAAFSWKNAQNSEPVAWDGKHLALHYYEPTDGPELFIMINMEGGNVNFTLPESRTWKRVLDTQVHFETTHTDSKSSGNIYLTDGETISDTSYGVVGHSIVVLESAQ